VRHCILLHLSRELREGNRCDEKQRHSDTSYLLDASYCLSFNQRLFGNALIAHNILIDASVCVTGGVYFIIMVLIQ
jgi:hypothetical protein